MAKKKSGKRHTIVLRFIKWAFILFVVAPILFTCGVLIFLSRFNIAGTTIESITRYPDSELIWSGGSPYGSSEWITTIYYRWSADDVTAVQQHYDRFPTNWQARVISVDDVVIDELVACNLAINFPGGCDALKANLPDYGTLIIFSHRSWSG